VAFSSSRLVRLLLAYAPRVMRLLRIPIPKLGLVLRVDGAGSVLEVLGDPSGAVVHGVTSATEEVVGSGGSSGSSGSSSGRRRLFLGSIAGAGVRVLDLGDVQPQAAS
jgi:hypothetical protein